MSWWITLRMREITMCVQIGLTKWPSLPLLKYMRWPAQQHWKFDHKQLAWGPCVNVWLGVSDSSSHIPLPPPSTFSSIHQCVFLLLNRLSSSNTAQAVPAACQDWEFLKYHSNALNTIHPPPFSHLWSPYSGPMPFTPFQMCSPRFLWMPVSHCGLA